MKLRILAVALALGAMPAVSLTAQATAPGLWPEQPLDPSQKQLHDAVVILRDSLRAVEATSARMERASASGTSAVVMSGARVLAGECARASREAARAQARIKGFSTSEKRGDEMLDSYRRSLLALQHEMTACSEKLPEAIEPTLDATRLERIRSSARKAIASYEVSVHTLMKTLSIPLDPKGHKSAIQS